MGLTGRLTLAMVALVVLTAVAVGSLTYRNIEGFALPRALDRIDSDAHLLVADLGASATAARADVAGFRAAAAIEGIIAAAPGGENHPVEPSEGAQWRRKLAARFAAELAAKPDYLEFRLIGVADGGREIVRVDRSGPGDSIRVVPDNELQAEGDRGYFRSAIHLPAGAIDVSPVELNRQLNNVALPDVPEVGVSTLVRDPAGRPFGIIIIDVDLRRSFARIRAATRPTGRMYVVNDRGDYLVHPDRNREFGFEVGQSFRIQDDYPKLDELLRSGDLTPQIIEDRTGARFGIAAASVRLADGPRISIVEALPYATLLGAATNVRNSTLVAGLAAVVGAIVLAIFVARSLTRPLTQMAGAIETFGRNEPMAAPVDAGGEIGVLARAFTAMAKDVRDKEAELTKEIEERRRLFNSSVDLILITDRVGTIVRVNPSSESILGYRPDEMIGQSAAEFLYPEDLDGTRAEMRAGRLGRVMRSFDCRYVRKDGRVVTLAWTGVWSEPEQRHMFIGRDMTERTKLEQQLRQSQKMDAIGQLTGGVAHDFNNILTVITGTIEILQEGVADRPQLAAITKMIDDAATRGADLTQQLLAFARKQPLQPRTTDINALVVDAGKLLRPTLGEQIDIDSALEGDAWPALVDPSQLSTALLNLAINARDAMPGGGKLTLETGNVVLDESYASANPEVRPGPYVMIAVSDTGGGIPAAIREKVFEPFFTTKEVGKGTGLGLSMVYGFVKQSGGHVKIYSEEGHGTTVKLYLPRAGGQVDAAAGSSSTASIGGTETILVVEDDALVRNYVVAQLQSLGYRPLAAASSGEALDLLVDDVEIDLLFTDVIMLGPMNGRRLADEFARRRPAAKVLYTSGYTENAIVHHGRLDPGVALLNKPYRKSDLARKIREVLDAPGVAAADAEAPARIF